MSEGTNKDNLSNLTFEEGYELYKGNNLVDVSNGLGSVFDTADKVEKFVTKASEEESRHIFPFIGLEDGRFFMIGGKTPDHLNSRTLASAGVDPSKVSYYIQMEGIESNESKDSRNVREISKHFQPSLELTMEDGTEARILVSNAPDSELPLPNIEGSKFRENTQKLFGNISGLNIHV